MRRFKPLRPLIAVCMLLAILQTQCVFWVGLFGVSKTIQTYHHARTTGWVVALKKLPQGSGNCQMCKKIRLAKEQQDRQQSRANTALEQLQSMNLLHDRGEFTIPIQCRVASRLPITDQSSHCRLECPPTPPPRLA